MKKLNARELAALSLTGLLAVTGCSDAPKQYKRDAPAAVSHDVGELSSRAPVLKANSPEADPGDAQKKLTEKASLEPMIYGSGAAGVSFNDTYDKAALILPKYDGTPTLNYGDMVYYYKSGLEIWFRTDAPTLAEQMLLLTDYQGTMDIPAPIGPTKMGRDFTSFFSSDTVGKPGQSLIVHLFNALEKTPDSFNCIEAKQCAVSGENDPNNPYYVLVLPKAQFLLSKDRKVLSRILLIGAVSQGNLANDLDLIHGSITAGSDTFKLDDNWGSLKARIGTDTVTSAYATSFGKNFFGISLGISRSKFGSDDKQPEPTDALNMISVGSNFQNLIKLGEKFVIITPGANENTITLTLADQATHTDGTQNLQIQAVVPAAAQKDFMLKLTDLIAAQLSTGDPNPVLTKIITGFNNVGNSRTFVGKVNYLDPKAKAIRSIQFGLDESTGAVYFAVTILSHNPADVNALPKLAKGVTFGEHELAGFGLNQTLTLSNVDDGNDSASFCGSGGESQLSIDCAHPLRGSYSIKTTIDVAYSTDLGIQAQSSRLGYVGDAFSTMFGLQVAGDKGVISVLATDAMSKINNLCGIDGFDVPARMSDTAFKSTLDSKIASTKVGHPTFRCDYLLDEDINADSRLRTVYFPAAGMKVSFADHELSEIKLYTKPKSSQ